MSLANVLLVITLSVTVSCDISLSPDKWPKEEFDRLRNYTAQTYQTPKPLAVSRGLGIVTGTSSSLAVHAGLVALREGGNAMDSCVATALTEIVLATGSFISFAGITEILYYKSSEKRVYSLDGGWNIPTEMDSSKILPIHTNEPNGASVLVPGFMAGIDEAVSKFAKFSLATLMEPALYFAENGFKVPRFLAGLIRSNYNDVTLLRTEQGKKIFTNPDTGKYYKTGEILKQPDMYNFLKTIAKDGISEMYNGTWAEDMVELVQKENGFITLDDMKDYKVNLKNPLNTSYNGYIATSSGGYDGGSGGVELIAKLNLIQVAGINLGSESYLTNSTKLYWLASIIRFCNFISFYQQDVPNGLDILKEEFQLDFVLQNRLSKDFAKAIWDQMVKPGGMEEINDKIRRLLGGKEVSLHKSAHSAAVIAMDKEGNVCSMIHTINSLPWGTGLFIQGVALPHSGAINKARVKQTKPGNRLSSELQPGIVLRRVNEKEPEHFQGEDMKNERGNSHNPSSGMDGWEPAMALAVIGSSLREATPLHITSIIDEQKNPEEALSRPQFMLPSLHSYYQDVQVQRYTIDENILSEVRKKGQVVTEIDDIKARSSYGLGVALTIGNDGTRYAASTPFLDGIAEGENLPKEP